MKIERISVYIAFIICIMLILVGICITIFEYVTQKTITYEIWNLIIPIITLTLGYIFGKRA